MIVHLIDGTYELFRHFYDLRRFNKGIDKPLGATVGVLNGILQMTEDGVTHIGVTTDHVIESFRNKWLGPTSAFAEFTAKAGEPRLLERAKALTATAIQPNNR